MAIYRIERCVTDDGNRVEVHLYRDGMDITDVALDDSLKLGYHSPGGFEFGYSGSGPTQLAIAILLACTRQPELSLHNAGRFRDHFISKQRGNFFGMTERSILRWLGNHTAATI